LTTITIINPFSGATVERDITEITQAQVDAYAQLLDDETLYAIEGADTPVEWLEAYVAKVGPTEAGRVILGS
jgi:hypothetical protein